jgi:L-glyceraldehyde 3-phosphate reductase
LTTELKDKIIKLNNIAKDRNQTLAEMALSWVLIKEEVSSVIIGASSKEQVLDNIKVNKIFTETELQEIDKICLSV